MNRGENSDTIPIDLIPDILSRLPTKSIARFRCVSKLWGSLLRKPYFTELFLTRSSARPRLLIGVKQHEEWFIFSSPQPQNLNEKSSLVVAADFHTKISFDLDYEEYTCRYASGLLYLPSIKISKEDKDEMHAICNPSTGQYVILPEPRALTYRSRGSFLGFDPIGKQFKILVIFYSVNGHQILTLGTEKMKWRTIQYPLSPYHFSVGNGICINGVLYYVVYNYDFEDHYLICFDVRSEIFNLRNLKCNYRCYTKLINYKGKLGVIDLEDNNVGGFPLKLRMWVLEDVEKGEWSTYVYTLRTENKVIKDDDYISIVGVTAIGEIVLAKSNACEPFYVFYFNPERNTLLSVEIQGVRVREGEEWSNYHEVYAFVDHVEDLKFDDLKKTYAATSITPPEQSTSSTSFKEYHQVRTVADLQQYRNTFESVNNI